MSNAHTRSVKRAERMVGAYNAAEKHSGCYDELITDMLADLFHYARSLQVDREMEETIEDLIRSATMHFNAEINEED